MPPTQAVRARIVTAIEPVVAAAGYDLEEVVVAQAGRRTVVRVVVDTDAGVTLDDIAAVSRDVSAALDGPEQAAEPAGFGTGPYTLEVTSPGVDRPLTLPRHWRRNVGRLVAVRADGRDVTARVLAADDAGVTLRVEGGKSVKGARPGKKKAVAVVHPYPDLGPGRVQIEFNRLDETELDLDDTAPDDTAPDDTAPDEPEADREDER